MPKIEILENRDDLVEGTFCYALFEDAHFSPQLLEVLIAKLRGYLESHGDDSEVSDLLEWLVNCTDQCFLSHKDKDDLYRIKNYTPEIEDKWIHEWKSEINRIRTIGHS